MSNINILKQIIGKLPVVFGAIVVVFFLIRFIPGDPVDIIIGQGGATTSSEIAQLRDELYLNETLNMQFWYYLQNIAKGDLGQSYILKKPVAIIICEYLPATIELAICALIFSLAVAIPAGIISAISQNSLIDRMIMLGAFLGVSMPSFLIGLILIFIFAVWLKWFPMQGRIGINIQLEEQIGFLILYGFSTNNFVSVFSGLVHLFLPSITLGIPTASVLTSIIRIKMIEALNSNYITFARAKGLSQWNIVMKHAFQNSLSSAISVLGLQIGVLLSGSVVVETVFGWPGLGRIITSAILNRDYYLIQGIVLMYAFIFIATNLAVDILYPYFNPRIRQY